jgi:NADH dehydrogenase (ubiquinone) 1 alpha subcomplex subunit 8
MSESPASSSELLALWKFIGAACRDTNRAFMACKAEDPRPEQCLKQGEATIACANNVYVLLTELNSILKESM